MSWWLETCDCPKAWVSLDENDNDLHLFLNYFLSAIQTVFPNVVCKTLVLVPATILSPGLVIADSLINELDLIDQDFILVPDDFHSIQDKSMYELLTELRRVVLFG